ncbi:MAG: hypothetical protein IKD35_04105 [Clostridia bacterium]|nr:hypothetical protein [Clostridia bacterium]
MWSNVISIDKRYKREIDCIKDRIVRMKDLSFAIEESKDRLWIYLASLCEKSAGLEDELTLLMDDIILTYMKTTFFLERLPSFTLTHATCSLICSLVHFDRRYEENLLRRALAETADFNVDGLYNFRLMELKQNWEEVISLATRLMDSTDSDAYDISAFITSTDNADNRVAIDNGEVYNLTTGKKANILNVFDNDEFNLIMAVIGECPDEIIVERSNLTRDMLTTLKHIAHLQN